MALPGLCSGSCCQYADVAQWQSRSFPICLRQGAFPYPRCNKHPIVSTVFRGFPPLTHPFSNLLLVFLDSFLTHLERIFLATIRKHGNKWQAIVRRKGFNPRTRSFSKKSDVVAWANKVESELDGYLLTDDTTCLSRGTLGSLLIRYRDTVTPTKKSRIQEANRIERLLRHPICQLKLDCLSSGLFASYRDERLRDVGAQAVRHELNTFSIVMRTAKLDWDIPLPLVYTDTIKKPRMPSARTRRLEHGEYERLRKAALASNTPYIWQVADFAIESAMRKSEVIGLRWQDIHFSKRLAHLSDTKNGLARDVPLTHGALGILNEQKRQHLVSPFPYGVGAVSHAWRKVCNMAGIDNLRFHDLRHEAISRFFERGLKIPEVAIISGHQDFRMLAQYTHLRAEDVVLKL